MCSSKLKTSGSEFRQNWAHAYDVKAACSAFLAVANNKPKHI